MIIWREQQRCRYNILVWTFFLYINHRILLRGLKQFVMKQKIYIHIICAINIVVWLNQLSQTLYLQEVNKWIVNPIREIVTGRLSIFIGNKRENILKYSELITYINERLFKPQHIKIYFLFTQCEILCISISTFPSR